MRPVVLPVLVVVDLLLLAAIAALWTTGDPGWQPPAAHPPDAGSLAPEHIDLKPLDPTALTETLERPLFSRDRRPPDTTSADVDAGGSPDDMVLLGTFDAGGSDKGVVLRAEGVVRRVRLGESIGPWRLEALQGRVATFTRDDERRELELAHLPQPSPAPGTAARSPPAVQPPTARPGATPGVRPPPVQRNADRRQRSAPQNQ